MDEFTGRLMPDRTWRDGLHQAVEAKEALDGQPAQGHLRPHQLPAVLPPVPASSPA